MNDKPVTRQEHEDRIQRLTRFANINGLIPILAALFFTWTGADSIIYILICAVASWMLRKSMLSNVELLDQMGDMMLIADQIKADRDNLYDVAEEKDQIIAELLAKVQRLNAEIEQIGVRAQSASDSMDVLRAHVKNHTEVTVRPFNHAGLQQGQTPSANYQQG